ncbi:hypothetical protein ANO14919_134260 [Xylariales sp. No.14919]|nr:hypothetical protein ANO14919_134260 [Xylariales sp. No.14919]
MYFKTALLALACMLSVVVAAPVPDSVCVNGTPAPEGVTAACSMHKREAE